MIRSSPAPTKGIRRNRAAPDAPSAVLSYWYGLSGVLSKILLELYRTPRGLTDFEIAEMLGTHADLPIVRVYISYLRTSLRNTLEGMEAVHRLPNPRRGERSIPCERRYKLTQAMREDVRETLELAFEQMSMVVDEHQPRAAA